VDVRLLQGDFHSAMEHGHGRKVYTQWAPEVVQIPVAATEKRKDARQELLDSLPVVKSDAAGKRRIATRLMRLLVTKHTELDKLRQQRDVRRKRRDQLKAQLGDISANSKKADTQPRTLQIQSKILQLDSQVNNLQLERRSMECLRERLESDWIVSVARLRDRRAILQKHNQQDDALTKDYLNRCRNDASSSLEQLADSEAALQEGRKHQKTTLGDMRIQLSLKLAAEKADDDIEQGRRMVLRVRSSQAFDWGSYM